MIAQCSNFVSCIRSILQRYQRAGICLMFHSIVAPDREDFSPYCPRTSLPAHIFEEVISQVARHYYPLSIEDFTGQLRKGNLPPRACMITFDDGFQDNLRIALPILESHKVPATIYVTTGFVDGTIKPFEFQLCSIVECATQLEFKAGGTRKHYRLESQIARKACYEEIRMELKFHKTDIRQKVIQDLSQQVCCEKPDHLPQYLSWQEIQELSRSSFMTIGCHGHGHIVLGGPGVCKIEVVADIRTSKELLEKRLSQPIRHFSYPYGASSSSLRATLEKQGFRSAVTTQQKLVRPGYTDVYQIPRLEVSPSSWRQALGSVTISA